MWLFQSPFLCSMILGMDALGWIIHELRRENVKRIQDHELPRADGHWRIEIRLGSEDKTSR
jgi:hypothetical protein